MAKLTWEDINLIREIMFEYNKEIREDSEMFIPNDKTYAEEVLRRFEERKDVKSRFRRPEEQLGDNIYICKCGAELQYEGSVMTTIPPQYPYTCPKCGKRYVYRTDGTRWEW